MKRATTLVVFLIVACSTARAQKIETEKPGGGRIVHVQTALNHLTVIEVGEPVTMVAAGSDVFKVEWRENKVFVQPTEPGVATNLFVWTAAERLNYELDPAGPVTGMDFAIDEPVPPPAVAKPAAVSHEDREAQTDALLGGRPVRLDRFKEPKNRVIVLLKDTFRRDNELFVRYAVRNDSKQFYDPGKPQAFTLHAAQSRQLYRRVNSQVAEGEVKGLEGAEEHPAEVLDAGVRSTRVAPGQETVGVVGVNLPAPKNGAPTVLRLTFANDSKGPITATLVL